jgi:hypothetical protein
MAGCLMTNELGRMRKEVVVAYFTKLHQHLSGWNEKNQKQFQTG